MCNHRFLHWLEEALGAGHVVSEADAAEVLQKYRADASDKPGYFVMPSFATIAGCGSNGAIIHYRADPDSCKALGDDMFLLDRCA